jgi:hypothetical protein
MDPKSAPATDTSAAAAATAAAAPEKPATSSAPAAKGGKFVSSALEALSKAKEETAKSEAPAPAPAPAPAEPAKPAATATEEPVKPAAPAESDPEHAAAEADIKRETASMSASHKAAFTKLRYEARDLKRQLKAAEQAKTEAVGPEAKAEASEELTRLKAEYDTLKGKVENYEKDAYTTRLESTELFQKEVAAPRRQISEEIGAISDRYEGIDPDAVISAVRSADPEKVSRVTAEMSEYDRFRFYKLVEDFKGVSKREEDLRANSKDSVERIYREQREREEAKRAEEKTQWEKSIGDVWSQLEEEFPILAPVEGDNDWNASLEKVKSFATPDRFEKLTVRERAEALHRAAAFPVLVGEMEAMVERLKEAEGKLAKYEGATPGVGSDSDPADTGVVPRGTSFMDAAVSALKKAGAR